MRHGGGGKHDAKAALARIEALTDRAYAGDPTGEPACDALGLLLTEIAIPRRVIEDIIAGFAHDAADRRPRSEADLLRHCTHFTGAGGVAQAKLTGDNIGHKTAAEHAPDP